MIPENLEAYFHSEAEYQQWRTGQVKGTAIEALIAQETGMVPTGISPVVIEAGQEYSAERVAYGVPTNAITTLDSVVPPTMAPSYAGQEEGIEATAVGFPLLGAAIAAPAIIAAIRMIAGRFLTVATFRALIARFGPLVVKTAIGAALFGGLMHLIGIGAGDDAGLAVPRRRKRYSIGHNPRVRTLARVAAHCKRLLKRHEKVIRAFLPKAAVKYGQVPSRLLSAAEKELIKRG